MKFGQFLLENMVSEWHSFYIDYHKLKKLLKTFKKNFRKKLTSKEAKESFTFLSESFKNKKDPKISRQTSLNIKEKQIERQTSKFLISFPQKKIIFYRQLCIELYKVEFFFNRNIDFYRNKLKKIEKHLSAISKYESLNYLKNQYEVAIKELYKEMDYMNKYIDLNLQAKRKILKKFNKYNQTKENIRNNQQLFKI